MIRPLRNLSGSLSKRLLNLTRSAGRIDVVITLELGSLKLLQKL